MSSKIFKAIDERREITAPILVPEEADAHGDIYSADEILKACRNFNEYCEKANVQHEFQVSKQTAEWIESYIAPADMVVNGVAVTKGTWMGTMKVHNDSLWDAVKEGEFTGFSIGCKARVERLDEQK